MKYRDTYRIVTSVSRYVSYREVSVSLQAYSTCVLETLPGKLDIKRREPGIIFISLQW